MTGYEKLVGRVRQEKPLVHHITNYVTVNDCANITLEIGASPIMADARDEAGDIAAIAAAVVLNLGTLNERTVPAMILAGKAANEKGIPVILDPVGAGASAFRNAAAKTLLEELQVTVIRGNISEIRFLAGLQSETRGVDASEKDAADLGEAAAIAKRLAGELGCVVAITGAADVISDGQNLTYVKNGHPMLSGITGTGCMCTSLIGSFCGAVPEHPFKAAVAALMVMGIAGEIAFSEAGEKGSGSFRTALHDAISRMDENIILKGGRYDEA